MLATEILSARQVTQYVPATWRKRSRWLANQRRDWIDWIDDATRDTEPKAKLWGICEAERSHVLRATFVPRCSMISMHKYEQIHQKCWTTSPWNSGTTGIISTEIRCGAGLRGLLHWWLWTFVLQNHLSKTMLQSARQCWRMMKRMIWHHTDSEAAKKSYSAN